MEDDLLAMGRSIWRLLAALFLTMGANASQSLSGGTGTATLPNTPTFANLSNFRVQFRMHGGWSYNGTYQLIFGTNSYALRLDPTGNIFLTSWRDGSAACSVSVAAGTDIIGIVNRFASNLTIQIFNSQTGVSLNSNVCGLTPGVPNDAGSSIVVGGVNGALAYVRAYGTTVPIGTAPGNRFDGNLYDYEFEGNGTDQTGNASLTLSGASFVSTPAYPPAASLNPWPTLNVVRAGSGALQLTSTSFDSTDNATLSYFWQQLSGPAAGKFSSRTSPVSTFQAPVAGNYRIQLSVSDSTGATAVPAVVDVGAVATDSNGAVITGLTAGQDSILGPVLIGDGRHNPWPYGDLAEISVLDSISNAALANPPVTGTRLSGTVTLTNTPVCMVGTGTHFTTELIQGNPYIVSWDSVDGPGTGRFIGPFISSIADDTHACFGGVFQYLFPTPSAASVFAVPPNTPTFQMNWWQNGNLATFWEFYDGGLAKLHEYYRTGIANYLTQARQLIDYNWTWMIDHGFSVPTPRATQLISQFWRALDGHPERFPGLFNLVAYYINNLHFLPLPCPNCDTRESGYVQWFTAIGAKTDPDPARHAQYCSWVASNTAVWIAQQTAQGYWPENVFSGNPGYVYAAVNFPNQPLQYGASPWRMNIAIKALEASYESLRDTSSQGCNNPGLAASLLGTITNAVSFVRNYGYDSNPRDGSGFRGIYYDVEYQSNAQGGCGIGGPTGCTGTVSINVGSTTLSGSGTNFQTVTSGTGFVGIANAGPNSIYKVVSCASQTSCTITPPFGTFGETTSVSGNPWYWAPPGNTNCGGSLATTCLAPGSRDLDRLAVGSTAWLYNQTGNSTFKAWADEWYAAAFGGPDAGPNSAARIGSFDTAQPCGGPGCDGFITEVIAALPNCDTPNPAPCTSGGSVFAALGKNANEAFGAPASDNALVWRLGGLQPQLNRTIFIGFNLASVPNAARVNVTLTEPSGTKVSATCTSSPCAVTADARQGDHLVQLTYLSASGAALAVQDPASVTVF